MKTIFKSIAIAAVVGAPLCLTSCLEEVLPTTGVTQEMLGASANAGEAIVWGQPSYLNICDLMGSEQAYDWGYPAIMHMRDVMTGDFAVVSSSYDWFSSWAQNNALGENYMKTQWIWYYFMKQIQTSNEAIKFYKQEEYKDNAAYQGYLGMSYAFRAFAMLDAARMYEFLPNDAISPITKEGNNVEGLTIPISTEELTEAQSKNNPRAPHFADKCPYEGGYSYEYDGKTYHSIAEFILDDLNKAEALLVGVSRPSKVLPNLACVYGLKARYYMWNEDYLNAADFAQKAIAASGAQPLNKDQWHNTGSGFNDITVSSWMWGGQLVEENDAVQTGILNWTSWASNETSYGYAAAGPVSMVCSDLYDKISNNDFRKLTWVAPEGSPLSGKESFVNSMFARGGEYELCEYASLKFRPGMGNYTSPKVGSATAFPLMRVEEMYFNWFESVAHTNPAEAVSLLENFMKDYRYVQYTCKASSSDEVVEEVVLQKRIELWGEGQSFFDYKRLNMSVDRVNTNFPAAAWYVTDGRPAWMNTVIVLSEGNNNAAVAGWNNPDPTGCYKLQQ